jgi:hypothetical protein
MRHLFGPLRHLNFWETAAFETNGGGGGGSGGGGGGGGGGSSGQNTMTNQDRINEIYASSDDPWGEHGAELNDLVSDRGGTYGGDSGGGGGDSSPEGTSAADAYQQYADTMIAGGGGTNLSGTGSSAYEVSQALAGRDDPVVETGPSGYVSLDAMANTAVQSDPATSDLNVAPVVDYSDIDLGGLPLLPQEIPVEYKDTTSGIEKVVDFYSPPAIGYDLRDPNEPEVMMQDGKPFSGIASGNLYASGQPVGAVSMDDIASLGELELPDLSLALPTVSAIEPVQTGLEAFEEQQYEAGSPTTVPDFMVDMDPFDVETVQQLADQYYDGGSEPMSVAEQVAFQYDPAVNLDTLDAERELASSVADVSAPDPLAPTGSTTKIVSPGGVGPGQTVDFDRLIEIGDQQYYDIYSPPLSDDDMGLPDISVDEAMLDPLGLATGGDDDPYSATLADDVVGDVGNVVISASVPDVDIPSNKNVIDAVVAGVLTGTPVEGFDILTSNIGMPKEGLLGDLNNLFGSLGGQIILNSLIPGAGLVTGFASMVDPQKRQRIADMLSGYSGQAVYNSKGELIGAVDKMTGEYVGYPSNEGGYIRTDDGQLIKSGVDVPKYADPFVGGESDDGCPAGYEFDATIGQCVPIGSASSEEEPKISIGEVERPVVTTPRPPRPPSEPVEGMTIRAPKQFNVGGPVTPNIDRFLGSLRG